MRDPDCIFCKIVAGELPATIVDEDERTISFMDISPATRGHALVIPREHSRRSARASSARTWRRWRSRPSGWPDAMKERLGADGVNLLNSCGAVALQTVFHFHMHVIPRYEGDPLRLPWVRRPATRERDRGRGAGTRAANSEMSISLHLPSRRVEWQ